MHTNFSLSLCTAYDKFVSNLKSSLSIEKQKNSLLSEEVKIKKGTVERLRSELENTKEQLEYMKEEKGKKILHMLYPLVTYMYCGEVRLCSDLVPQITGAWAVFHKIVLWSETVYPKYRIKCNLLSAQIQG